MSVSVPVIDYIDGATRRIYLLQGVDTFHWIEDIYREYCQMRAVDEALQKWFPFMKASGNDPKGGGKYTPRYITLLNGARVVPYDENILITVTGEAITDNADVDPDPFDTSTRTQPLKLYITPPAAELVKAADELAAIERMAFDGVVTVNKIDGYTEADKYLGTAGMPCKFIGDALAIANAKNIGVISVLTDDIIDSGLDYRGKTFVGASKTKTTLTIHSDAQVDNCEFYDACLEGTLDGETEIRNCQIKSLNYISGYIESCELTNGTITLGGGAEAHFLDCWTGIPSQDLPSIDLGGSGQSLVMKNFNGVIKLINKTGPDPVSINLEEGIVYIDFTTVTNGTVSVDGDGSVRDFNTDEVLESGTYGSVIIQNNLSTPAEMAKAVWTYEGP